MITTELNIIFNVLLVIAISLVLARILGFLFHKIGQPAVIGEVLAGIILGGIIVAISSNTFSLFNYQLTFPKLRFNDLGLDPIYLFSQVGILFLLFISGLETNITKIKRMGKASSFVAVGGVVVPFILGFLSALILGLDFQIGIILGLILVATSVGVTVRTLMDINELDSDVGATILGSAVIDDVIGILLLAFVIGAESVMGAVWIGVRIAIFFLIFLYLGLKIIDKVLDLGEKIHLPKAFLSISLAILLIYSFFADKAGISGIIGAFIAGILIGQNVKSRKITEDIKAIGYGLFIPIFFVYVGLSLWDGFDAGESSMVHLLILFVIILIISIIGKIIGCWIGAKAAGLSNTESLQIGVGMIPRMELALIIVTAAISHKIIEGVIAHELLLVTIFMTISTTFIAPFLIKATFKKG